MWRAVSAGVRTSTINASRKSIDPSRASLLVLCGSGWERQTAVVNLLALEEDGVCPFPGWLSKPISPIMYCKRASEERDACTF